MKKTNVLVLVMFFFLATGCASTHKYSEDGRLFSYDENFKIIINTTNKGEIIQHYGIPTSTDTVGKYQILTYKHSQESFKAKGINPLTFIPVVGLAVTAVEISSNEDHTKNIRDWELMVIYTDLMTGVVKDYYYNDSKFRGHDESERLFIVAQKQLVDGKTDEALQLLEKSVSLNSRNHRALNALAWQLIDQGIDLDKGVEYAQQAVSVFPDSPYNNGTLGVGYLKKGDAVNAEKYLQTAVDLFPTYAPTDNKGLQYDKAMLQHAREQKKNS